jgi:hypothetical protein
MKEESWISCTDPNAMMEFLRRRASHRKLRLFACACCRRIRSLLRVKKSHQVLEACEQYADGKISRKEMEKIRETWYILDPPIFFAGTWHMVLAQASKTSPSLRYYWRCANLTASHARLLNHYSNKENRKQAALLRDIFGNPFRPEPTTDSSWLSWNDGIVPKLAQAIYDDRAFDRMPILADALEEAGCTNADILNHCRQPGEHVRGSDSVRVK